MVSGETADQPVNVDKVPVFKQSAGEQAEVDDEEDEVEAEELCVVPDVSEGELSWDGGEQVLWRSLEKG